MKIEIIGIRRIELIRSSSRHRTYAYYNNWQTLYDTHLARQWEHLTNVIDIIQVYQFIYLQNH